MNFYWKAALSLAAAAVLSSGFALNATAQGWQTAVAQGTYAVYSDNREVAGIGTQAEYFIQTFRADGTVAITNHVLKTPPAKDGGEWFTATAALCQGTYSADPGGIHRATCGDDTVGLLIVHTEAIDGVLVATEMRGMTLTRGTRAGEVLEYVYRRLPAGWENAVLQGTYAGHTDFRYDVGYTNARYFYVNVPASGNVNWHHMIYNNTGAAPGKRAVQEQLEFITRGYAPNGRFPGIHQALDTTTGAPTFDWLILAAEKIGGVMVATEVRGFGVNTGPQQWHYTRIGDKLP